LGETVAEQGELMLRAFILVVSRVIQVTTQDPLVPVAMTHKAETVEILGHRWYSKACRSDREAVALINQELPKPRRKQVYCYLGGGGLTEASTFLAQGVVCKTKTWDAAAAVCTAVGLLTAAVPGRTVLLEESFCTTDSDAQADGNAVFEEEDDEEDTEETPDEVMASGSQGVAHDFAQQCRCNLFVLASKLGLPEMSLDGDHVKSESEAQLALPLLRAFMTAEFV
jgi:hypothetical protein